MVIFIFEKKKKESTLNIYLFFYKIETVKEPNSPIIQKLTKTLAQLQADHEYGTQSKRITNSNKHLESNVICRFIYFLKYLFRCVRTRR